MNRDNLIENASNTLSIFKKGYYQVENNTIDLINLCSFAHKNSELIKLDNLSLDEIACQNLKKFTSTHIYIVDKSVVDVIVENNDKIYGVLNFASAYHPGGGFMNGSMAQEESLCYSSNLYCLQKEFMNEFYTYNKRIKTKYYSDRMIYTPKTVFIKNNSHQLLKTPILANIISSPAVNLGAVKKNIVSSDIDNNCYQKMKDRMRKILFLFSTKDNDRIILGAFGCGVFKNNPSKIAEIWKQLLIDEGWQYNFQEIIFAVYDNSPDSHTFLPFYQAFNKK